MENDIFFFNEWTEIFCFAKRHFLHFKQYEKLKVLYKHQNDLVNNGMKRVKERKADRVSFLDGTVFWRQCRTIQLSRATSAGVKCHAMLCRWTFLCSALTRSHATRSHENCRARIATCASSSAPRSSKAITSWAMVRLRPSYPSSRVRSNLSCRRRASVWVTRPATSTSTPWSGGTTRRPATSPASWRTYITSALSPTGSKDLTNSRRITIWGPTTWRPLSTSSIPSSSAWEAFPGTWWVTLLSVSL